MVPVGKNGYLICRRQLCSVRYMFFEHFLSEIRMYMLSLPHYPSIVMQAVKHVHFFSLVLLEHVVGTALQVLFRVLRGLCRILLWDDEDYDEEIEKLRLVQQYIEQEKENALRRRLEKRLKRRVNDAANELAAKNKKITSLMTKRIPCNGTAERLQSSDISESLNSECNTLEQGVTSPLSNHSESRTVANGRAHVLRDLDQRDAEDPTITYSVNQGNSQISVAASSITNRLPLPGMRQADRWACFPTPHQGVNMALRCSTEDPGPISLSPSAQNHCEQIQFY
ncbi:hypothetical protein KIN20_032227 [Parelaphostrongylus tenuis]|uniref:Uncharacterized protein n=1 Tax=Parelaphostrongylus tenuis TaxID=148309 RepID=A0AAD5R6A7_PARTN|nr:hypothetical protein KIN20_032227 [Parelaphostrongylus tenuis]